MHEKKTFVADALWENERVDRFLADAVEGFSREALKSCFSGGDVSLNGVVCKPAKRLCAGDVVEVRLPESVQVEVKAENIPLNIVYEDDMLLVVDKAQGMVVHPGAGNHTGTLVNALLYHCAFLSAINGVLRPGIVHRIDKDTSGLLVVCKTNEAHQYLARQFADHTIERCYYAIVHGVPSSASFTVRTNIARDAQHRLKMSVCAPPRGKHSVTHAALVRSLGTFSLMRFTLETGRTHQIRVHMSAAGHPIVGDALYGRHTKTDERYAGQLLHAAVLGFVHPNGNPMRFVSPLPSYFQDFLDEEITIE